MPYISIAQAAEATGKSEKTIRRLVSKPESKNYVTRDGDGPNAPVQIEVSYLESVYPMSTPGQSKASVQKASAGSLGKMSMDSDLTQQIVGLQHQVQLLTLELRHKEELTQQKERQIQTLEKSLLLLGEGIRKPEAPLEQAADPEPEPEVKQKKRWWPW